MNAAEPQPVTYHDASRSDRTWLQARDRWEELDRRHHLARAEANLKARGEWDAARHGAGGTQPLTLTERLEVLANGEVVARVYRHPYQVHWALEAGASWQQIAEAAGISEVQARQDYREFTERQHRLWIDTEHRFGLDDTAYAAAIARGDAGQAVTGDEDQAAVVLAALEDAAESIRERAAWCRECQASPAELCDETADQLRRADAYDALAARMRQVTR